MTTSKNRQIASRWISFLSNSPSKTAHKFQLMEVVEMSQRSFESFKTWFLWKHPHVSYQTDTQTFKIFLDEKEASKDE